MKRLISGGSLLRRERKKVCGRQWKNAKGKPQGSVNEF